MLILFLVKLMVTLDKNRFNYQQSSLAFINLLLPLVSILWGLKYLNSSKLTSEESNWPTKNWSQARLPTTIEL